MTQALRRREIVDATLSVMTDSGSTDIRLADVARRLGKTTNAIRYYFKDNEALRLAVREHVEDRFVGDRRSALAAIEDPRARMVRAMELGLPSGPDDIEWRVTSGPLTAFRVTAEFDEIASEVFHRQQMLYRELLDDGVDRGLFTLRFPADDVACLILSMEDYFGVRIVLRDPRFTRAEALRMMTDYAAAATGAEFPPGV